MSKPDFDIVLQRIVHQLSGVNVGRDHKIDFLVDSAVHYDDGIIVPMWIKPIAGCEPRQSLVPYLHIGSKEYFTFEYVADVCVLFNYEARICAFFDRLFQAQQHKSFKISTPYIVQRRIGDSAYTDLFLQANISVPDMPEGTEARVCFALTDEVMPFYFHRKRVQLFMREFKARLAQRKVFAKVPPETFETLAMDLTAYVLGSTVQGSQGIYLMGDSQPSLHVRESVDHLVFYFDSPNSLGRLGDELQELFRLHYVPELFAVP